MNCRFYNFSKRKNSTSVPASDAGTLVSVFLKEPTSKQNPVLTLNAAEFDYNYAKLFNMYYFVSDVTHVRNDLTQVTLEKDVLGTYRSQILASDAYVMYDSVGNSEIVDTRLAIKTSRTLRENYVAFPNVDSTIGRYVLSCVGRSSSCSWVWPYRMNPASIISSIFNSTVYDAIDEPEPTWGLDIADNIKQFGNYLMAFLKRGWSQTLSSGNALESIRGCIWLPFDASIGGDGATDIVYLGNFSTGFAATKIINPVRQLDQVVVDIPWGFSDWRRNAPYTQVYLYIPFIGVIQLPAGQLTGAESITIRAAVNIISGDLSINVLQGYQVLGSYGANVGMSVPLGASNITPRALFNSLIAATSGAATAGVSSIAVGAAALSGVASATAATLTGSPTCVGGLSNGAAVGLSTNIICFTVSHDTTINPSSVADVIGLPSFQKKSLSSLRGYVQCHEFSLDAEAPAPDLESVNRYMNSGVFLA